MEKLKTKYLIVGAGVSGMSFANYVDDYIIVEKEKEIGGYCRTIQKGNFIWDYAGHFFHFSTEEFRNKFLNNVADEDIINKDKCTKILYKNNVINYPFQTNIHQLPKDEFIDCLYDLYNKTEKEKYDDFLDMLYGKFGKSITEKFLKPYNEKLYACDLHFLDKDAMGRFFPYADINSIINNMKSNSDKSYNNKFLYPKKGAGSFMDILYSKLDSSKVLTNMELNEIDVEKKLAYTENSIIEYDFLINTIPLNKFLGLIGDKNYQDLINELSYNKVLVFNLGFNKKSSFNNEHWMYIPDKDVNFYRIGFYDNILDFNKLSMYIEIGFDKNSVINETVIQKQLDLTLSNLLNLGIIDENTELEEYVSIVMDPAYVHINHDTNIKVKETFNNISKENIYSIGRYGAWTYCSMEDCMIEAKKLAEKLENK